MATKNHIKTQITIEYLLLKMDQGCEVKLLVGCGKEGVTLAKCTNVNCIKKFKAKQDRKQPATDNSTFQGQHHLNVKVMNEDSKE
jgi:hypothetical protein